MTGDLTEHVPAPLPLIARYYESLGFSTPGTEYDPASGTYQSGNAALADEPDTPGPDGCAADPQACARWLAELGDEITLEAS